MTGTLRSGDGNQIKPFPESDLARFSKKPLRPMYLVSVEYRDIVPNSSSPSSHDFVVPQVYFLAY